MNGKDKKIQRAAKALTFFGTAAILSLAFRLWPVVILSAILAAVAGVRYAFLVKKEKEKSDESVCAYRGEKKPAMQQKESLQDCITESINKLTENGFPGEDWLWEYPDPVRRLEKGKDVCIILFGENGFRKAKVVFSGYNATALELLDESADEQSEISASMQSGSGMPSGSADYGLIAFEWTDAHITELNGRCNDAIGRGEKELALAAEELPVRESWSALCDELVRVGVKSAERRDNGIVIGLS